MRSVLQVEHLVFLSLVYFFLILGYIFSLGFYSFSSLWISLGVFSLLLSFWFFGLPRDFQIDLEGFKKILSVILVLSIALALFSPKGLYETDNWLKNTQFYLFLIGFFASLTFFLNLGSAVLKNLRFVLLIIIAFLSKIFIIINSPMPKIDVFDILQKGSLGVIHGQNPYAMVFDKIYVDRIPDYFTYLPVSFLLTIPTRIIFGDVRYTFIIAELIFCGVIFFLGKKEARISNILKLLILIFLFHPLGTFVIEESWLDPLTLSLIALFGFLYLSVRNSFWAFLILALAFGVKQNMLLIVPFILKLRRLKFRNLILGFFPVLLIIGIFFFLSPADFIADTIKEPLLRQPRFNGLTLFSFFHSINLKIELIQITLFLPFLFLGLFLVRPLNNLTSFFLAFTIWFLSSLIFFREAFLNHYYFVTSLLILTISFGVYEMSALKKSR